MLHQADILAHALELHRVGTLGELLAITERVARAHTRYRHSWVGYFETTTSWRVLQTSAELREAVFSQFPVISSVGDQMIEQLQRARAVVVVNDARTDPRTNKEIVNALGNRTIINVPMLLGDQVIGTLGVGTFGDEGVLEPTPDELTTLTVYATLLGAAIDRLRREDEGARTEAERRALTQRVEALERVELMGLVAGGVANELRQQMQRIEARLVGLTPGALGDDWSAVEDSLVASRRSIELIRQLGQLGQGRTRTEKVDLNPRIAATLGLLAPSLPSGVVLSHTPRVDAFIAADPVHVDQVLINLVINARDAVGSAGSITVSLDEGTGTTPALSKPAKRWVRLAVRDTGVGMAPEVLSRIFEPLYTTKRSGTGLGLAVVSQVARQYGWLLHCESQVGRGTTFEVTVPAELH